MHFLRKNKWSSTLFVSSRYLEVVLVAVHMIFVIYFLTQLLVAQYLWRDQCPAPISITTIKKSIQQILFKSLLKLRFHEFENKINKKRNVTWLTAVLSSNIWSTCSTRRVSCVNSSCLSLISSFIWVNQSRFFNIQIHFTIWALFNIFNCSAFTYLL